MHRLDYWAEREFQFPILLMMEHAGRGLVELLLRRFGPSREEPILALAGKGANGGAVLAAARHLAHRGYEVSALTTDPPTKMRDETRRQLSMFRKEGASAPTYRKTDPFPRAGFILDGILGSGDPGSPKGTIRDLILATNRAGATVIAMDLPSGLHPDTGEPSDPTIRAAATITVALPKKGLFAPKARPYVGEAYLADIGFPRVLYEDLDVTPEEIFGDAFVVRLPDAAGTAFEEE